MLKLEQVEYIKYDPVLTSNKWTILMLNQGRAKGNNIKLDISHLAPQGLPVTFLHSDRVAP